MSEVSTSDSLEDALRQADQKEAVAIPRLPTQSEQSPGDAETVTRPVEDQQVKMRSEHLEVFYGSNRAIKGVDMSSMPMRSRL